MSDFEEFARSQGFSGDFQRGCNGQYKSDLLHFMEKAFMHQQVKIDEYYETGVALNTETINQRRYILSQSNKINELQKRVDEVCDLLDRAEINHRHLLVKYQSTKLMEYNASKRISDAETQIAVHWGADEDTDSVLRDVEKALRGEHENSN